jgi:hypothetical protein
MKTVEKEGGLENKVTGRTWPNQKKKVKVIKNLQDGLSRIILLGYVMKRNENRTLVINLIQWDCFVKKKDKTIVLKEYIQFIIFFFYPKK